MLRGHSYRETNEAQLYSTSQLGFVYGRLLILQSELWDHNLFKKMWKFTRNVCATAHEQNKYRATSGVGGSKKNLNRFHLGFAWTFYMIMAVRLSNNSRASDVSFLIGISSTWNYFYCPTLERGGRGFSRKKYLHIYVEIWKQTTLHFYFLFQIIRFEVLILIAFCFEKKGIIQSSLLVGKKN